jgi:hypothetical protein
VSDAAAQPARPYTAATAVVVEAVITDHMPPRVVRVGPGVSLDVTFGVQKSQNSLRDCEYLAVRHVLLYDCSTGEGDTAHQGSVSESIVRAHDPRHRHPPSVYESSAAAPRARSSAVTAASRAMQGELGRSGGIEHKQSRVENKQLKLNCDCWIRVALDPTSSLQQTHPVLHSRVVPAARSLQGICAPVHMSLILR